MTTETPALTDTGVSNQPAPFMRPTGRLVWMALRPVVRVLVYGDEGCAELPPSWEVLGVFSSHDAAVERCERDHDFVGPLVLDHAYPDGVHTWEGGYYPNCPQPETPEQPESAKE